MAYGLTTAGFVVKPLQTIITELEADYQTAFGANIDLSSDSNFGVLIGNQAKKFADIWELLQAVYASFNPDSAEGAQLDNVGAMKGAQREAASASSAFVMLYGTIGTPIPSGQLINQPGVGVNFSLQAAVTLATSSVGDWRFHIGTIQNLTTYSVTVNGVVCSYTTGVGETAAQIVQGILTAIDTLIDNVSTSLVGTVGRLYAADGATSFSLSSIDAKITTDEIGCPGYYLAVVTGPTAVPAGTLTNIMTPVNGLSRTENIVQGSVGANKESDSAFRIRQRVELQRGAGTDNAVKTAIAKVTGVTSVTVLDNRSDNYDSINAIPAHSILCVVTGGQDALVAAAIWSVLGAGTNTAGTTSQSIVDANGATQTVKFSRPQNMYIWLNVQCSRYTEESIPANAARLIAAAIAEWALTNYTVGIDVILQRIIPTIYATVTGIKDIVITATSTSSLSPAPAPGAYSSADISVGASYIAMILEDCIQVGIS